MKALLLTGNTYPIRRDIRARGGVWDREDKQGYFVPFDNREQIAGFVETHGLELEEIDVEEGTFEPLTTDELREYRQDRANNKADTLRERAERRLKEAEELDKGVIKDMQFWTEPLKPGHHSYNRHRNLRDRQHRKMDKVMELRKEAQDLKRRADSLEQYGGVVKGDAERKYQEMREYADTIYKVGSEVYDPAYREGVIKKVNKKTYTVIFTSGWTTTRDKSYFVRSNF